MNRLVPCALASHLLPVFLAFGCAGTEDERTPQTPPTPPKDRKLFSFEVEPLSAFGQSPAAAVLPGGDVAYAFIDAGQPVLRLSEGDFSLDASDASALALAADEAGALHLAFQSGDRVFYTVRSPQGAQGPIVPVALEAAREPNLAVSNGRVAIAYVENNCVRVRLREGEGLTSPSTVRCPEDHEIQVFGDPNMGGVSIAIAPDGALHLVYEWKSGADAVLEYRSSHPVQPGAQDEIAWREGLVISQVAFLPCPAIAADEDGVHITYLAYTERWYAQRAYYLRVTGGENGVVGDPVEFNPVEEGEILMLNLHQDSAGAIHLISHERGYESKMARFVYRTLTPSETPPVVLERAEAELSMMPRAGGFIVSGSGELILGFDDQTSGEAAAAVAHGYVF